MMKTNCKAVFDISVSYSLRGLVMLYLLMHHICARVDLYSAMNSEPLAKAFALIFKWGSLASGIFFLISGYGMYCSMTKHNLSWCYLYKAMGKLLGPYFFYVVIEFVFASFQHSGICWYMFNPVFLLHSIPWFFAVIFVSYVFLFLLLKSFDSKIIQVAVLFLSYALYIIFAKQFNIHDYWYNSVLCFPLGVAFACYRVYLGRINPLLFLISTFILLLMIIPFKDSTFLISSPAVLFSLFCVYLFCYVPIQNKLLNYIGVNSLCFYLFHGMIVRLYEKGTSDFFEITLITTFGTFLLTFFYVLLKKGFVAFVR